VDWSAAVCVAHVRFDSRRMALWKAGGQTVGRIRTCGQFS
jgi:hypothetical protein